MLLGLSFLLMCAIDRFVGTGKESKAETETEFLFYQVARGCPSSAGSIARLPSTPPWEEPSFAARRPFLLSLRILPLQHAPFRSVAEENNDAYKTKLRLVLNGIELEDCSEYGSFQREHRRHATPRSISSSSLCSTASVRGEVIVGQASHQPRQLSATDR